MVEFPGNVMQTPGYSKTAFSQDDELLASMKSFTQKGVTLKAGQGKLLLGTVLAQKISDKKWYKYDPTGAAGVTNESQSVTEGGAGLTSFTLTYAGQTTGAIAASSTVAQVQAALDALSNLGAGQTLVAGPAGASTGPWTVTFQGTLADTNVAQMTSTPTGGSGTVTVATVQGGNTADGTDVARGFLRTTIDMTSQPLQDFQGNIVIMGVLKLDKITTAGNLDAGAITTLNSRSDTVLNILTF